MRLLIRLLAVAMLRAIRLVVDTGFHSKHWSRQKVVDYFHNRSAIDQPEVQSETDRYMAWPAQALGYKIGQLEILKLRQYSKDQLGGKFDLRAFHNEVLWGRRASDGCAERAYSRMGGTTEGAIITIAAELEVEPESKLIASSFAEYHVRL